MKKSLILLVALSMVGLTGCSAKVRLPGLSAVIGSDGGGHGDRGGPRHCPPGQAKKGNC